MILRIIVLITGWFFFCGHLFAQPLPEASLDQTSPEIQWVSPAQGSFFNRSIPLQVQIHDNSKIVSAILRTSLQELIPLKQDGQFWMLDYSPSQEAKISLVVEAKDEAGNASLSPELVVVYDITPPQGTLQYPKQAWYKNHFMMEAQTQDALSQPTRIEFKITASTPTLPTKDQPPTSSENQPATPDNPPPPPPSENPPTPSLFEQEVPVVAVSPNIWQAELIVPHSGSYALKSTIWDQAGNSSHLPEVLLPIDIEPPLLKCPSNTYIFTNQTKIDLQVEDQASGVAEVAVLLHEEVITSLRNPEQNCTLSWDVTNAPDAGYPLVLQATDCAGNQTTQNITMIVDHQMPKFTAEVSPSQLQIGDVHIQLTWEDKASGIDTTIIPRLWIEIRGKSYPVTFSSYNFSATQGEASFLVTSYHPEGIATIYLEGLQDQAGHTLSKTKVGQFVIRSTNSYWPLLPNNQAHPLLGALDRHRSEDVSGIWIAARAGVPVSAIEDGQIVEVKIPQENRPGYLRIQRLRDSLVWGYHHIYLAPNRNENPPRPWLPGDIVQTGEVLGTIPAVEEAEYSYLYLELVSWQDQNWVATISPLEQLHPKANAQRISPYPLIRDSFKHTEQVPHLQFAIPLEYLPPPEVSYTWRDLLLILYFLFTFGILLSFRFFLTPTSQLPQETNQEAAQQFWNKFRMLHHEVPKDKPN